ncbi:hypothetical protein D3C71_1524070 [compost metagenome]
MRYGFNHDLADAGLLKPLQHFVQVVFFKIEAVLIKDYVRQNHGHRLVTHQRIGTHNGVPKPFGNALTYLHHGHALRTDGLHFVQQLALNALFQHRFQLKAGIEMVFDRILGGMGNQHNLVNPRGNTFINHVLDQGFVDQRQHFFWNGFCRR